MENNLTVEMPKRDLIDIIHTIRKLEAEGEKVIVDLYYHGVRLPVSVKLPLLEERAFELILKEYCEYLGKMKETV